MPNTASSNRNFLHEDEPGILSESCAIGPISQNRTYMTYKALRSESLAILSREEETKDHVPEVVGIRVQRVQPVLKSNSVRVAPQVTEVLHRHKRTIEELVRNSLALHYIPQHLAA